MGEFIYIFSLIPIIIVPTTIVYGSPGAGVELGVQQVKLEHNLAYGYRSTKTKLSSDDLGLDNSKNVFKPALFYEFGDKETKFRLDLSYEQVGFNGSNTLTKSIVFNRATYDPGDNIRSKFEFEWARAGFEIKGPYSSIGFDWNYVTVSTQLSKTVLYNSEYYEFKNYKFKEAVFFSIVLGAYYNFSDFSIESKVKYGSDTDKEDSLENKIRHKELYVGLNMDNFLLKNGKLKAGYQYRRLDFAGDELDGDLRFKGPFVGFNYRF